MIKRILTVFIVLIGIAWSVFVTIDLLSSDSSIDFKKYFNASDQQLLIVHQSNEIDWNSEFFKIIPSNQTVALSLISKLSNKASVYISATRPIFIVEKRENWTKNGVEKLLKNGLYNFEFTGRKQFKFGNFTGEFKKNQLLLYSGILDKINNKLEFPQVDTKASYSVVDFIKNEVIVTDVYQKRDKLVSYKKSNSNIKNTRLIDDKLLFSSVISTNFENYCFYENQYFIANDPTFKQSSFNNWVKTGIVFLSNGNSEIAVFDFIEGQNPIQNLNEKLKLVETNESFGTYDNFKFCDRWKNKFGSKFYVFEKEGFCIVSYDKSYLDEVLTEMNLAKTLSQNVEKSAKIFSNLPVKVMFREVSKKISSSRSIINKSLVEVLFTAKEQVLISKQTVVKEYFSMNPGETISDFVTFNGRGNVIILTQSNKLIAYSNGAKSWEKQLNQRPSFFSVFSFRNNTISIGIGNETQILDINGKLIYRFSIVSSVVPYFLAFENKELFFIGDGESTVNVINTAGKSIKKVKVNGAVRKVLSCYQNKKILSAVVTSTSVYISEITKNGKTQQVLVDTLSQVYATEDNIYITSMTSNGLVIQQANGTKSLVKTRRDSQLMNVFTENGKTFFLLKSDKKLIAVDVNGKKLWERNLVLEEISSIQIAVNQAGKIVLGILDTIENRLYLYDARGNKIDDSERHGEKKLELSPFGTNAFSITTYLGSNLIQYTKQ